MRRPGSAFATVITAAWLVLSAASLTAQQPGAPSAGGRVPMDRTPRLIVHALGMVDPFPIRNCRECFEASVKRGYTWLEADLLETADGGLAVTHDGLEAAMALPRPFTLEQFHHARLLGALQPLDAAGLAGLMCESPETVVVTDFKTDPVRGLPILVRAFEAAGVDWRRRVVPQVYLPAQLESIVSLGFEQVVLTMYRFGNHPEEALRLAGTSPRIVAVAIPDQWFKPGQPATVHAAGKRLYVHTVNDRARADELFALGVDGIYTDVLTP